MTAHPTRSVLMIAFHYPPCAGGSGIHRTTAFCRHLPEHGWRPIVLTASPGAYGRLNGAPPRGPDSPAVVVRALALDTARHLALLGRYPGWLALPDRWVSWVLSGIPAGLRAVRRHRPAVIWSTYPIASAHLIGVALHRLTGLPWVADFRDSMSEAGYPRDPAVRRLHRWIERAAVRHAAHLVFTAPSCRAMYLARYPALPGHRCLVIQNGYAEEDFARLAPPPPLAPGALRPLRLVHSGLIYPEERDPRPLFAAVARCKAEGRLTAATVRIELRASGCDARYAEVLRALAVDDLVHLLPPLPHREALQECAEADALLLLQSASCNHQIPAKAYEYLRCGKPILALTDAAGDTAALLAGTGGATIADPADAEAISRALGGFLAAVRAGAHPLPAEDQVARYSRRDQSRELARALTTLLGCEQATGTRHA
jgi:glycosyltransferase involved in cell wall biosynthesis